MPRAFTKLAFTPSVKAVQERQGSRELNLAHERAADPHARLGPAERAFLEERDGFYQATVAESGWPYVQFRGGPPGFLKVLDDETIGYADLSGNRQYLSVGNLEHNPRVALILIDYEERRRLKVWGEVTLLPVDEARARGLSAPRMERGVLIRVVAWEWNCRQHIPQRRTIRETT